VVTSEKCSIDVIFYQILISQIV